MSVATPRAPSPSDIAPGRQIRALDGVRALAVAGVIAFHAFPQWVPGGFVGVDVFFVLSGYLITAGLLDRQLTRADLGGFWLRRARRLLPALALLVLGVGTLVRIVGSDAAVGFGGQTLAGLFFFTNWRLIGQGNSYFAESAPPVFQHLWSLAVEEQFYLLWPLVVLVLVRLVWRTHLRRRIVGVLCCVSLGLMVGFAVAGMTGRAYYGSDSHCFGLLAGAMVAIDVDGLLLRPLGRLRAAFASIAAVAGLVLAFVFVQGDDTLTYVLWLPGVVALTVLLTYLALHDGGFLRRTLGWRPLVEIGRRSYGLYLWHWPLLIVLRDAAPHLQRHHPTVVATLAITATGIVATASYALVERPIRRLGFRGYGRAIVERLGGFGPRTPWVATGLAAALGVSVAMTVSAAARAPHQTSLESQLAAAQRAIALAGSATTTVDPETTAQHAPQPPTQPDSQPDSQPVKHRHTPPAKRPATPTGPYITAIGDSVMLASAPALLAKYPGISIDAVVSRQATDGPGIVAADAKAHKLRPVVLVALGTNGYLGPNTLRDIRKAAGPWRELVFVNVFVPREWQGPDNAQLRAFAAHDKRTLIVDWYDTIKGHTDELDADGIHPGATGGRRYASAVASTMAHVHLAGLKPPHTTKHPPKHKKP